MADEEQIAKAVFKEAKALCDSDAAKENLRSSFKILANDIESSGLQLMKNLFTSHPDTLGYFARFKDVSLGKQNWQLRGHAITLMYALMNFVDALDEPDRLKCVVLKFAVNHNNRSISPQVFGKINGPMDLLLKQRMGKYYNRETANAWKQLVGVVQAALTTPN
uniref:Alpha chain of the tetrameric hemoglobin (Intracellular) n=1 Tax=Barbatia trapezina TaxID=2784309 RepID=Q17155_9BIVA|nr:alpha chain of the tetrameric hemoglobin (intracellular) [Barbatia lima]